VRVRGACEPGEWRAPQADSVIPVAPPTLLLTLPLHGLLPLEQEAPVDIAQ